MHKLAPFTTWQRTTDTLVLRTPDYELGLRADSEPLLEQLKASWLSPTAETELLADYGAVISAETEVTHLLYQLEAYFCDRGLPLTLLRKGATEQGLPLFKVGYKAVAEADSNLDGFGQDSDPYLAMLKAVVELYERYSCRPELSNQPTTTDTHPAPEELTAYADWQLASPDFRFSAATSGEYVEAISESGRKLTIPRELVYFPMTHSDSICGSASSNGVAAYPDLKVAKELALYELIERDALMVHWFNGQSREQIVPPNSFDERLELLKTKGFEVTFLNLTLDTITVVATIMRRQARSYPRLLMGLAAHPNPLHALDKALQEVEVNATYVDAEVPTIRRVQDIRTVMDHQYWYDQPENQAAILHLCNQDEISYDDLVDVSKPVHLPKAFYIPLNADGQRLTGVHVIRAIVPGFVQIGFGFASEPLALARLHNLPAQLGWTVDSSRRTQRGYQPQPFA